MADLNPDARFWHVSQSVGENVYVWGGRAFSEATETLLKTINEFSTKTRSWCKKETEGTPHPGLSQVACASFGNFLYLYGGSTGEDLSGVLSKLDLTSMTWAQLSPEKAPHSPMKKDACGMIHFKTYEGKQKLLVMCGYAQLDPDNTGSSDEKSELKPDVKNAVGRYGWTNEIHLFNTGKNSKANGGGGSGHCKAAYCDTKSRPT